MTTSARAMLLLVFWLLVVALLLPQMFWRAVVALVLVPTLRQQNSVAQNATLFLAFRLWRCLVTRSPFLLFLRYMLMDNRGPCTDIMLLSTPSVRETCLPRRELIRKPLLWRQS